MSGVQQSLDRDRALLEVVSSVASQPTVDELFRELTAKLSRFVHFDRLVLLLQDEERPLVKVAGLYSSLPYQVQAGFELPIEETPAGEVIRNQRRRYIADIFSETSYPQLMKVLRAEKLRTICYLPLTSPSRRLGALAFATQSPLQYTEEQLSFMEHVLKPVAIAVDNILNREQLERERDRLRLTLEVNNALVTRLQLNELFEHVSERIRGAVPHDILALTIWDAEEEKLRFRTQANPGQASFLLEDEIAPLDGTASGEAFKSGRPVIYGFDQICRMEGQYKRNLVEQGIRSLCAVPLRTARGKVGAISLSSRDDQAYDDGRVSVLQALADQLAIAVENAMSFAKVEELNRKLWEAKLYLEEELQTTAVADGILGNSPGIRKVIQQIQTVAPTDATVLILGETGSGKELVARALHQKSPRGRGTFVKLNCAAIPTGLLESELFGHEKGAFTGAIAQKIGRCEIAHQGTLFLDEIGDIPLELQPKLLRVLQEKEFERLGSNRTIRSDARLVAATNRDLKKMAEENRFRADLYYRLNVFPITVPPLRERKDDIPYLAMHFTREFSRRLGKNILSIPKESMESLTAYHWPGNIRELQNLIERSVILSRGETLRIPLQELEPSGQVQAGAPLGTMEEVERETILRALRETHGIIGGAKGAAAKLGLKRTTLLYRMDKLGIKKSED
jgi:formate hydrogenlyase transcriptional activator